MLEKFEQFFSTKWPNIPMPDDLLRYDYMIYQLVKAGYSKSEAENMTYEEAVQVFCFSAYEHYVTEQFMKQGGK